MINGKSEHVRYICLTAIKSSHNLYIYYGYNIIYYITGSTYDFTHIHGYYCTYLGPNLDTVSQFLFYCMNSYLMYACTYYIFLYDHTSHNAYTTHIYICHVCTSNDKTKSYCTIFQIDRK